MINNLIFSDDSILLIYDSFLEKNVAKSTKKLKL